MLIQQLKELQADGIIDRLDLGEIPQRSNISSPLLGPVIAK
jgi:DNA-binding HxlR family transcriptional regulator